MAAGGETELRGILVEYVNSTAARFNEDDLIKALKKNSVDNRYDLLTSVRSTNDKREHTAVHLAAWVGKDKLVKWMLDGFTHEQAYEVLELLNTHYDTPLHRAASCGHVEVVKYLLSCVDQPQRFNLLIMKEFKGNTVLHEALCQDLLSTSKQKDTAELILSTLPLQQQLQLINIKDKNNKTVADLYPDFIAAQLVVIGLAELKSTIDNRDAKVAKQEKKITKLKDKIAKLEKERDEQEEENDELKQDTER